MASDNPRSNLWKSIHRFADCRHLDGSNDTRREAVASVEREVDRLIEAERVHAETAEAALEESISERDAALELWRDTKVRLTAELAEAQEKAESREKVVTDGAVNTSDFASFNGSLVKRSEIAAVFRIPLMAIKNGVEVDCRTDEWLLYLRGHAKPIRLSAADGDALISKISGSINHGER